MTASTRTSHPDFHRRLLQGIAIPAMPLALTSSRKLDERRQRALCRYYIAAGAGGIAAAVHTTQFEIRNPKHALFKPVLELVSEEFARATTPSPGTPGEGGGEGPIQSRINPPLAK